MKQDCFLICKAHRRIRGTGKKVLLLRVYKTLLSCSSFPLHREEEHSPQFSRRICKRSISIFSPLLHSLPSTDGWKWGKNRAGLAAFWILINDVSAALHFTLWEHCRGSMHLLGGGAWVLLIQGYLLGLQRNRAYQ